MRIVQSKSSVAMAQDLFSTREGFNRVPQGEERVALRLYLKYADRLLGHFDEWKDFDRFYFIPIGLNMAFFCPGGATAIAFPPYFVGTILRNSLEYPELFAASCMCGHQAYAYAYNGSPWSGRVDLSCACPHCGKHIEAIVSGWKSKSEVLKESQKAERWRIARIRLLHPHFEPAGIQELLRFIGLTDEELVLPPEEHRITRTKIGNGQELVSDSAGGDALYLRGENP